MCTYYSAERSFPGAGLSLGYAGFLLTQVVIAHGPRLGSGYIQAEPSTLERTQTPDVLVHLEGGRKRVER